jgi:hypothetical protein
MIMNSNCQLHNTSSNRSSAREVSLPHQVSIAQHSQTRRMPYPGHVMLLANHNVVMTCREKSGLVGSLCLHTKEGQLQTKMLIRHVCHLATSLGHCWLRRQVLLLPILLSILLIREIMPYSGENEVFSLEFTELWVPG